MSNDRDQKETLVHASYLMLGFLGSGMMTAEEQDRFGGQIGAAFEVTAFAYTIAKALEEVDRRGFEYPGVFDYEVTEGLGAWLRKHIDASKAQFCAELVRQMTDFFNADCQDIAQTLLSDDQAVRCHREVSDADALLNGKPADAAKQAKATSPEEPSSSFKVAPVIVPKDSDALEEASEPLLLECSMVTETPEIGVAAKGYFITNPFYDVGMIEKVDPMECWGLSEAQAKLIVALNEELAEAAEDAINAGCLRLQTIAGITDGGYAGVHFSGTEIRNQMMQLFGEYIAADINAAGGLLQPEFATQRHA